MTDKDITEQRGGDIYACALYHLTAKISYYIEQGSLESYKDLYTATDDWGKWRRREIRYSGKIYKHLAVLNACGITRDQIKHIAGFTTEGGKKKWIAYKPVLEAWNAAHPEKKITVREHGRAFKEGKGKTQIKYFSNCYFVPEKEIARIFGNDELRRQILDWNSPLYTPRQRRMIRNQLVRCKDGTPAIEAKKEAATKAMTEKAEIKADVAASTVKQAANVPEDEIRIDGNAGAEIMQTARAHAELLTEYEARMIWGMYAFGQKPKMPRCGWMCYADKWNMSAECRGIRTGLFRRIYADVMQNGRVVDAQQKRFTESLLQTI